MLREPQGHRSESDGARGISKSAGCQGTPPGADNIPSDPDGYCRRRLGKQVELLVGVQQGIGARRDRGPFAAGVLDAPETFSGANESDWLKHRLGLCSRDQEHRDLLAELGQPDLGGASIALNDPEINPQLMAQLGGEGREFTEEAEADSAQGATRAECGGILLGGLVRILGSELRHKRREVVLLRSFYFGDSLFLRPFTHRAPLRHPPGNRPSSFGRTRPADS